MPRRILFLLLLAGAVNCHAVQAPGQDSDRLPDIHDIVSVVNWPWIFRAPGSGYIFEMNAGRIIDLCKRGRLCKIEQVALDGQVLSSEELDKNGKVAKVERYTRVIDNSLSEKSQIYQEGAMILPAPAEPPPSIAATPLKVKDFLAAWSAQAYIAYAQGVAVTRSYRLFFWQMESANTLSLTIDGTRWWFITVDSNPAPGSTGFSFRTHFDSPHTGLSREALVPPAPSAIRAIRNEPQTLMGFSARYIVPDHEVLECLQLGTKLKPGKQPFFQIAPLVQDFDLGELLLANSETSPNEEVQTEGICVDAKYKIYFWMLRGKGTLFLSDLQDNCWLQVADPHKKPTRPASAAGK
jgi:hypothetical protein